MILGARVRPVIRICRVWRRTLAKGCWRTATSSVGRKVGQRVVEVGDPIVAGVVGAALARRAVDQIRSCVVANAWLTVCVLDKKSIFEERNGVGSVVKMIAYQRGGGVVDRAKLGGGHGRMRGAETVTGDDGVIARVIHNGIEEGTVDCVTCLISGRVKDVGDSTIWADGFELRPVDQAEGLQTVHVVLETE